jgi:hypothetical protein
MIRSSFTCTTLIQKLFGSLLQLYIVLSKALAVICIFDKSLSLLYEGRSNNGKLDWGGVQIIQLTLPSDEDMIIILTASLLT